MSHPVDPELRPPVSVRPIGLPVSEGFYEAETWIDTAATSTILRTAENRLLIQNRKKDLVRGFDFQVGARRR